MDYIDRRLRRLHADHLFWERAYRRALSRTWILRDRLAHIPSTVLDGIEGVASAASTLSAVADRAARLRRRAADARNRLAVFDPERRTWTWTGAAGISNRTARDAAVRPWRVPDGAQGTLTCGATTIRTAGTPSDCGVIFGWTRWTARSHVSPCAIK